MKRLLFLLFFLPIFAIGQNKVPPSTKSRGDYDQTLRARDTLFTDYHFVYRDTVIPVLDISYHEFSSDGNSWHKPWVEGDTYIRISNDVKNTWKVLSIMALLDTTGGGGECLWARDANGGIYNYKNDYDVHVMNSLEVEDSINTNNFYFLNGDSLKITWLNATDGTTGDILQNINGVAYWIPITSVFDSAGFYDAQNANIGGVGVWNNTSENVFYFRGIDGDDACITALLDAATNRIVVAFDPTCLSLTAGIGLSGGGAFDASGNVIVNLSIPELTTATSYDSTDWFAMYDVSIGAHRKVNIQAITGGTPNSDSVFWIAANDGSIDTVFNNTALFFEEGDSTINIEVSGDSVIFTVNGCPVPPGGTAGQVLMKLSDADCDLAWVNICDLVAACDTNDLVSDMCGFAAPYLSNVVPTTGHLKLDYLVSDTEVIGDYVIDWYLNGAVNFTSATVGAGITNYVAHPFTGALGLPVAGGVYTPIIRWVEINGMRYTSQYNEPGIYDATLLTCLDDIYAAPYECDNGGVYGNYTHEVAYSYTLSNYTETADREITFYIDATTNFIPWEFYAENVVDTLRIYYVSGETETLLERWMVGANQSNNFDAFMVNPGAGSFYKITDLRDYTFAVGDYIKFVITPSGLATDWYLRFMCKDTLNFDTETPFAKSYQTIDSTETLSMVYDPVACTYVLTFYTEDAHTPNDIQKYIWETRDEGNMTPVRFLSNQFIASLNQNIQCGFLWSPSTGYGCHTYTGDITYRKISDLVEIVTANNTDYMLFKTRFQSIEANANMSNYSADPENINHYKMLNFYGTTYSICGDDPLVNLPRLYTHYDKTNIVYDDANYTIKITIRKTVDGYTDSTCNTCSNAAASWDVGLTTTFYNTADFTYTFRTGSWNLVGGRWGRSVLSEFDRTFNRQIRTRYSPYQLHANIFDLEDSYNYIQRIGNLLYYYPAYIRFRITAVDPTDPVEAVRNFDVYNVLDVNGYAITNPANYRLVYRMVGGVGTWYETGL